jgi:small subunit ribosomal protein S33
MKLWKQFTPTFLNVIDKTARNVFGNLPIVNHRTGFKLLRRKPIGPIAVNHYTDVIKNFRSEAIEGFQTPKESRRAFKLNRLQRRGAGPPKKGQGKRAGKKK